MPTNDTKPRELKVTDKRIFTPEGDIREEFRQDIKPSDPARMKAAAATAAKPPDPAPQERKQKEATAPLGGDRPRTMADKAQNPGTAFADFVEQLIAQGYMALGLLKNPYQQKPAIDAAAARQMIEILGMLKEKTVGNLTEQEEDFLHTHLGELKLAFVQRTKSL